MGNSNASRLSSNPNFLSQPITDQHLEGGSNDGLVRRARTHLAFATVPARSFN